MALPARGMGLESVEELEATSPAQRPGAAARVRAAARALPVGDPGPLPLAAGNQSGRRHQQQDQGHQAGGLRLPGRRLLLPEDPGGLPRTWEKNPKKAPAKWRGLVLGSDDDCNTPCVRCRGRCALPTVVAKLPQVVAKSPAPSRSAPTSAK